MLNTIGQVREEIVKNSCDPQYCSVASLGVSVSEQATAHALQGGEKLCRDIRCAFRNIYIMFQSPCYLHLSLESRYIRYITAFSISARIKKLETGLKENSNFILSYTNNVLSSRGSMRVGREKKKSLQKILFLLNIIISLKKHLKVTVTAQPCSDICTAACWINCTGDLKGLF